jgi:hypothetical protein
MFVKPGPAQLYLFPWRCMDQAKEGRSQMTIGAISIGIVLLAIWLILTGLSSLVRLGIPSQAMGILALLAGILLLVGR